MVRLKADTTERQRPRDFGEGRVRLLPYLYAYARKALRPANVAADPNSSSMRSNWLYLQMRSVRLADPVLICPAAVPTARSAIVESSVSPDRWEMIVAYRASRAIATASSVSVTVPI